MRAPYDIETRKQVKAALDAGLNCLQVAARFGMHVNTVRGLRRLWRETGSVEPRPNIGGGPPKKLGESERVRLRELRQADPFAPVVLITERLNAACGVNVSPTLVRRELAKLGFKHVRALPRHEVCEAHSGTPGRYRARRPRAQRSPAGHRRYPSDLSDEQWALLAPLIPSPKPGGRPAEHDRRTIVDAILYVTRTGCQWRALPHDFPPWSTVYDLFRQWRDAGVWEQANRVLRERSRRRAGRKRTPSAAIIDSQSARTTEKGGSGDMTAARR